jgi:membrane protein
VTNWLTRKKRQFLTFGPVKAAIRLSKTIVLPGFDGQSIFTVARFFYEALTRSPVTDRAAAISFKFILAIFPALIMVLTLIPYIPVENFQESLMQMFATLMPQDAFNLISDTLDSLVNKKYSTLLSIGFILGLYFGSNTVQAILDGLHASHYIEQQHSVWKQRLISLGLVILLPIMAAIALVFSTASGYILDWLRINELIGSTLTLFFLKILQWVLSALLIILSISFLYNVADVKKRKWRMFSAGANISAIGVLIVSAGFAYFVNNFGTYNKLYGSLGAVLVTLMWIYANFITILIGFELNTSISRARRMGQQDVYDDKK